jgi:hypothetical protein
MAFRHAQIGGHVRFPHVCLLSTTPWENPLLGDCPHRCLHVAESEGDIHCHGLAWSRDPNEASAIFKYNTFFYVSLYDHLYQRGYVENSLGGTRRTTGFPMCGCLDEMPRGTWRSHTAPYANRARRPCTATPLEGYLGRIPASHPNPVVLCLFVLCSLSCGLYRGGSGYHLCH